MVICDGKGPLVNSSGLDWYLRELGTDRGISWYDG